MSFPRPSAISLRRITVIAVLLGCAYLLWVRFGQPYADAKNMTPALQGFSDFAERNLTLKRAEGRAPHRVGKVVVVIPGAYNPALGRVSPPVLHPAYYKLSSAVRARKPEEVGTLVLVQREFVDSQIFGREDHGDQKSAIRHREHLEAFNLKTAGMIADKVFTPPTAKRAMTARALKAMADATSASTIAKYIESLPAN